MTRRSLWTTIIPQRKIRCCLVSLVFSQMTQAPDGDFLAAVLVIGPAHGNLTLNPDGTFVYTPNANYNGLDSFIYQARDPFGASSTATVHITVIPVNDAPVAQDDSYATAEDTLLFGFPSVLANDSDIDGDFLNAVLVTGPVHGNLTLNPDGTFIYTPNANYNGLDSFVYQARDPFGATSTATVHITVTPVNDAPIAQDDNYTTAEDTQLTIAAPGVLGNDTDVDGDPLTAIIVANPSHGSVTLNPNGSFTYTPSTNYAGHDSFTYKANDGITDGNVATVNITVTAVNDPPVAINDSYTINEDTTLTTIAATGVLANDIDVDSTNLTASVVTNPSHGALTLNSDGSFTYVPVANYNGTDSFTYQASDSQTNSATANVTITINPVNDAPIANNDVYTTAEDTTLTVNAANGVLANDTDVDGNVLHVSTIVSNPAHGNLTLNADGSFTYVPATNYNGSDSFSYKANDGTIDSGAATVTINITPVNDAPVANNDVYTTAEDTTLNVNAASGVLANDTDVDGNILHVSTLVSSPTHGNLTLNPDGSFTYVPAANYNGSDSFSYKANDGTVDSGIATVTINITPVNDAPVAANDSYTTAEDTALTVIAPGVFANDTDVDGDPLTALLVSGPAHGALTLFADGNFTYTPNTNYNGSDSFTYKASDGSLNSATATVNLTVTPVNDAPVAVNDSFSGPEDTVINGNVLLNDTDVDGDALTAIIVANASHGTVVLNASGSFTYTPNTNYNGPDSFTYKASDGLLQSGVATVSLTVTPVNDAPVAANDSYTTAEDVALTVIAPGVLVNDSDVDGDPLTAVLVSGPSHGTLVLFPDGHFTYTPATNYNGADSFIYKAFDGSLNSATATVNLTVTPVNDAPVAANDSYSTLEDTALTIAAPGVLGNDSDVDGDPLTTVIVANASHGTVVLNANGSFTYTPNTNYNGPDSFTYKASDGSLQSSVATVSLTVTPVNDAPVAVNDSYTTAEDTALNVVAPGVLANDSDVDGDPITAVLVSGPSHGSLVLFADGHFNYTPFTNYNGSDSFTYKANDGSLNSANATVNITVTPVNDAPVAVNDSYTTAEDTTLTVASPGVLGNDTDVDGDPLTAIVVANPLHGSLALNPNGSFTYTPNTNYNGPDSFTYKASDGSLNSATATVNITVTPVNDAPVAGNDSYTTLEDTALTVTAPGVLGNDSDVDGDPITAVIVANASHGTVVLNANGSFTYTPNTNYNGTDTFTYQANDGLANSATATVTINVSAVDDAPIAVNDSYSVNEDTQLVVTAPGVLVNDTDIDSTNLTATIVSNPTNGVVTLNADGSFIYTPNTNYNGPDCFTYKASDGSLNSATATVKITVNAVNDAPVAINDSFTAPEDTVITGNVLLNDTDVEGDTLTALLVSGPSHGSLTLNANGTFTYTPNTNYNGNDSFTYKASDGQAFSAPATVTLTLTPVNDPPVAVNDGGGAAYTVVSGSTLLVAAPGILINDSDPDGDSLQVKSIVTGPIHGIITGINTDGSFSYLPNAGYIGTDTFTYTITDGKLESAPALVSITVLPNPVPSLAILLAGPITLNGQTGLFEQHVTVTNTGEVSVEAFRVTISGLTTNVTVYNATATSNGVPYVHYNAPLNPSNAVTLILEFYNPKRTAFTDTLAVLPDVFTTTGTNAAIGVHIDNMYTDTTGRMFIAFRSIVGRTYMILYSDDLDSNTWKVSTPTITAGTTLTQWYDDGSPKTDIKTATRFYRAVLVPTTP